MIIEKIFSGGAKVRVNKRDLCIYIPVDIKQMLLVVQ